MSTVLRGPMASDRYSTVSNAFARDARLSFKARGLGLWLFSQAPGWQTSIRSIAAQNGCGKESVMTGLQELERCGYLQRRPQANAGGRFGDVDYIVTDVPTVSGFPGHDDRVPETRVPETGTHKKTNFQEDQEQEDQKRADESAPALFDAPVLDRPTAPRPDPVNVAAKALADHWHKMTNGMGNFHAVRAVAVKALKAGYDAAAVCAAMDALYERRLPLTSGALDIELRGGLGSGKTTTNRSGHQPYRDDPSDWDYDDANPLEHR